MRVLRLWTGSNKRLSTAIALLVLFAAMASSSTLNAQSDPDSNDAQVQKLYGEAKAAEARGDLPGAAAAYESLLQVAPRLGPAYNNLGALYLRQREFRKAADVLEKGLKVDPNMTSATALLGVSLYEIGDYAGARKNLESVLRANSKDDNARYYLANDLIKLGELNLAAEQLQQLASRQPKNEELWYLLGKVHMKLSEEALGKLNEINPDSVWVHEVSGEIMEGMKNYDGALVEYKKAVEMAPQQNGTHYLLGNAYLSLSMWDQATEQFRAELTNDPVNCSAQWKLGNILLNQHSATEEALADVNKALEMCPSLSGARLDRARALIALDRHAEAVKDLEWATKTDPSEPSSHFLLAQAYRTLGRTQEAQAEMKIFSKLQESAQAASAEKTKRILQEKQQP
jgi:tetratricopeptide (TPR) repeat protein